MQTRLIATAVLLLIPCHLAAAADSDTPRPGELYFGWASTSITPDRPVAVAGQYDTRISGEVHDPLLATALAIETRDDTGAIDHAVWVSCDLTVIRSKAQEKVRQLVRQCVPELDVQKIIISATHTHSAPASMGCLGSDKDHRYSQFLIPRIAKGIERAQANLVPAKIGWAVGRDDKNVACRRWLMEPGTAPTNRFGGTKNDQARMHPGYGNENAIEATGPVTTL